MTMRPRDRRLQSEFEEMRRLAEASSMISFTSSGVPPLRYDLTLRCVGLARWANSVVETDVHQVELDLGGNFPLAPPDVVWRTPIFHPNFKPPHVCTGDIWYPAMSVAEFCVELCKLVQYKSFNMYDPLDEEASLWLWATLKSDDAKIPVDPRPIVDIEFDIEVRPASSDSGDSDAADD